MCSHMRSLGPVAGVESASRDGTSDALLEAMASFGLLSNSREFPRVTHGDGCPRFFLGPPPRQGLLLEVN